MISAFVVNNYISRETGEKSNLGLSFFYRIMYNIQNMRMDRKRG